ncbi:MAG: alpha/beta hydrolase [Kiritimatiellales bacterium]|nr:alpha/beta hydrolase [Kiritimatiellales bacterium]
MGEFSIARVLISTTVIYLFLNMYAWGIADGMIFQPQSASYTDGDRILKLTASDGEKISAVFLENPQARYTILHSHGNAEDIGTAMPSMQDFQRLGFSVLIYDYRGYGTSEGKPSEKKSYRDIEAAYNWLVNEKKIKPNKIILHGRSVGAGPSTWLATRNEVGGVILESAFTSAFRVKTHWKILPIDKFNNLGNIKKVNCPVLVMHGTSDRIIPFWHGQKLYKAAPDPKQSLWVDGAGHNNFVMTAGTQYRSAIVKFIELVSLRQVD